MLINNVSYPGLKYFFETFNFKTIREWILLGDKLYVWIIFTQFVFITYRTYHMHFV